MMNKIDGLGGSIVLTNGLNLLKVNSIKMIDMLLALHRSRHMVAGGLNEG